MDWQLATLSLWTIGDSWDGLGIGGVQLPHHVESVSFPRNRMCLEEWIFLPWVYIAKCLAHAGGCRDVWREPKPGHHRHAAFPCSSQLRKAIPVSSPGSHLSIYSSSFCFLFACSNPHFSPSPQLWQTSLPWYLSAWIEESLWHPFFGTGKVQYSGSTFKLFNGFESHGFLQAGSRASC